MSSTYPNETNGLENGTAYHSDRDERGTVRMTLAELAAARGQITRLRLLAERMYGYGILADVSYIHGELPDGTPVDVIYDTLDCYGIRMAKGGLQAALLKWAKREGVYGKAVGLFDQSRWSILY